MTPEPPRPWKALETKSLEIPRAEDLRTPNPLARLAAERWRLRRQGADRDALAQLGESYQSALEGRPKPDEPV